MRGSSAASILSFALLTTAIAGEHPASRVAAQRPQIPAIRAGITMVPVDVRVLDRDGRPVTDLKQNEFVILEDGVAQPIDHFSSAGLMAQELPAGTRPAFRRPDSDDRTPQNQRIFLIVLGRGRLQEPTETLDALIDMTRERLLPQDQVAVLAFNRATDFTIEHEKVTRLLERYKKANNSLDAKLASHFSGLQAAYGSKEIPARIQKDIDAIFAQPGNPAYRSLPQGRIADASRFEDDSLRIREALLTAAGGERPIRSTVLYPNELFTVGFDEYIFNEAQTRSDLESLYAGIEYLRHLQGEKHLLFVSERGLYLPRQENDYSIAAVASDARVVLDTIHTGGIGNPPSPFALARMSEVSRQPVPRYTFSDWSASQSLVNVSRLTGGMAARFIYGRDAIERIDEGTRFQYLLGYSPANTNWNGRFRRITVRVTRPGLRVLYRHGYYAFDQLVPRDRKAFMTYSRIITAGSVSEVMGDINVVVTVAPPGERRVPGELRVGVSVDLTKVALTREGDRHVGSLEIALFAGDRRENVVGEIWQTAELKLSDETYKRASAGGFKHSATIAVKAPPDYVKAVVYDPNGDVLGSTVLKLKK
jgi:VWFA-related protein